MQFSWSNIGRPEHKGERAIIDKMAELRGQGMSYGDVVCWLNVNGVRTKSRSAAWDRPTVFGILKRHLPDKVGHDLGKSV